MGNAFKPKSKDAHPSFSEDEEEEEEEKPPLPQRVLSGVYDMVLLKGVQELEDSFRERFGEALNCEPDDIPFDFDLMAVASRDIEERRFALQTILEGQPFSTDALIEEILAGLVKVDDDVKKHNEKKKKLATK